MTEKVEVARELMLRLQKDLEDVKAALNGGKTAEPVVEVEGQGYWSRSMVRQLKVDALARGYKGAIAAGDIAAKHAGTAVSMNQVAMESGVAKAHIGPDLGAFSKASKRLFKGAKNWPFTPIYKNDGTYYLMLPEVAEWWKEV